MAGSTVFRWRHRFLRAVTAGAIKLRGIVEADETFVLSSRKGERNLDRKHLRGGKASKRGLSDPQVPVLVAADRSGVTVSAVLPVVSAADLQAVLQRQSLIRTLCWSPTAAPVIRPAPPRWASAMRRSTKLPASTCGANCTSSPSTAAMGSQRPSCVAIAA